MASGALRAYADDIVIQGESPQRLVESIEALKTLEDRWKIKVNLRKSEILSMQESKD